MKYRVGVISLLLLLLCTTAFAEGNEFSEYAEGNVLMADDIWSETSDMVLGGYLARDSVATVTFVDLKDMPDTAWDVSAFHDGSVMAWTVPDGNLYDLFIGADGIITANVNCCGLFNGYTNVEKILFNGLFDTRFVSRMDMMFAGCQNLESLDISSFETGNVSTMELMFSGCVELENIDVSGFDTANVTNMAWMFTNCASVAELDVADFDTSAVNSMDLMFSGCSSLISLDLSNFDTSAVTNMDSMFSECKDLTTLDLENFDTSAVTGMNCMFFACNNLKTVNMSGWDTSSVESMYWMFNGCESLTELDLSSFDTSCVVDMMGMFQGCSSLKALNLSNFDTSSVENMSSMFGWCSSLEELDVSNFDTSSVMDMTDMFVECPLDYISELFDTDDLTDKAIEEVEQLLDMISYDISRQGLINELMRSGYSVEASTAAVDGCDVDWNEHAVNSALALLEYDTYSQSALISALVDREYFTADQAQYAVDNCGADWNEQAVMSALELLEYATYSRNELISTLVEWEHFTVDQAQYAADACNLDADSQAVSSALELFSCSEYSRNGLIDDLMQIYGFSREEAVYAVDNCGIDWNEEAVKIALKVLESDAYSREDLISVLVDVKHFSSEEAEYAADNSGIDWNEEAGEIALEVLESGVYSRENLVSVLVDMKHFSSEEAEYVADNSGIDWNEQALKQANVYLDYMDYTCDLLIDSLINDGFTQDQSLYAANNCGKYDKETIDKYSEIISYVAPKPEALLEPVPFDYTLLKDKPGFHYDEATHEWYYYAAYEKLYSDAQVVVGLDLRGKDDKITQVPQLYAWVKSASSGYTQALYDLSGISFVIDGLEYSYDTMWTNHTQVWINLGYDGKRLVDALANANSVTVKLKWALYVMTEEISADVFADTLKPVAQTLIEYDVWDNCFVDWEQVFSDEETCKLSIKMAS